MKIEITDIMIIKSAYRKLGVGDEYKFRSMENKRNHTYVTLMLPGATQYRGVELTRDEVIKFSESYEKETGVCYLCDGKKTIWESWSNYGGTKYIECHRCNGTGKAI